MCAPVTCCPGLAQFMEPRKLRHTKWAFFCTQKMFSSFRTIVFFSRMLRFWFCQKRGSRREKRKKFQCLTIVHLAHKPGLPEKNCFSKCFRQSVRLFLGRILGCSCCVPRSLCFPVGKMTSNSRAHNVHCSSLLHNATNIFQSKRARPIMPSTPVSILFPRPPNPIALNTSARLMILYCFLCPAPT